MSADIKDVEGLLKSATDSCWGSASRPPLTGRGEVSQESLHAEALGFVGLRVIRHAVVMLTSRAFAMSVTLSSESRRFWARCAVGLSAFFGRLQNVPEHGLPQGRPSFAP